MKRSVAAGRADVPDYVYGRAGVKGLMAPFGMPNATLIFDVELFGTE